MKAFMSDFSTALSELNLRPLLFVAGAATATAGAYYLYSKYTDQQQRKKSEDASVQTDPEDATPYLDALHLEELHLDEIHMDEQTMTPDQGLRLCTENEIHEQHHHEMCCSRVTLRLSYCCWHDRQRKVICVKRHFTLLIRGAVSQWWSVLSNDFYKPSAEGPQCYASAHRVTLAVHIDGRLARVASYSFTKLYTTSELWGVQVEHKFWSCQGVVINDSRFMVTVPCGSEVIPYSPDSSAFHQQEVLSRPQSNPEADEGFDFIEMRHVPALFNYCRMRGVDNFTIKLAALRQAFNIIFRDPSNRNYICMHGDAFCLYLAHARDRIVFISNSFHNLVLNMVESPTGRMRAELELAHIGIQQFNFMDAFFELILLGILGRARVFQINSVSRYQRGRGFLKQLLALISACTTPSLEPQGAAEQYISQFQTEMFLLLDNIFSLEESLNTDPNDLAVAVKRCLWHHMDQLFDSLERLRTEIYFHRRMSFSNISGAS